MAIVPFPASPADGDPHDTGNGVTYTFDAAIGAWRLDTSGGGAAAAPSGVVDFSLAQQVSVSDGTEDEQTYEFPAHTEAGQTGWFVFDTIVSGSGRLHHNGAASGNLVINSAVGSLGSISLPETNAIRGYAAAGDTFGYEASGGGSLRVSMMIAPIF